MTRQQGARSDAVVTGVTAEVRLNLEWTKASDLGKRSFPATLTDLHLYFYVTKVTDDGVQGLMQFLPESLQSWT